MIVKSFLKWVETADAAQRVRATTALTRAYATGCTDPAERAAAEAALAFLLDDPSPKVRLALAEGLASIDHAPRSVILGLAQDQIEVAARIIALSPVLCDNDLIEIVASGRPVLQQMVALRSGLSVAVSAALAEVAGAAVVFDLLDNRNAALAQISLRRIAERFGETADIRGQLFERPNLPCDVRQNLVERVGAALAGSGLIRSAIGGSRGRKVTGDACLGATLRLAETVVGDEIPALVEHLRGSKRLTPAFLMHALCSGNVDFFAAAVVSLSGMNERRVRGILNDGREAAIRALYRAMGIDRHLAPVFVTATLLWRAASQRQLEVDTGKVTEEVMRHHRHDAAREPAVAELLRMVETLQLNWRRQASRAFAHQLAAEAA